MEIKVVTDLKNVKLVEFGIEASNVTMTVEEFVKKQSVFRFNDPIQRNIVWKVEKKSLLIISSIEDVYIGEVSVQILRENKTKIRNVIDGKQRLTTFRDYIKNKYSLINVPYIEGVDEDGNQVYVDLNGKYFKDLPEAFQKKILSHLIHIREYEIDEEQKQELFYRWNSGEALKSSEKRKSRMKPELRNSIDEMKNLTSIKGHLSENEVNRDVNGDLVQQSMALIVTGNQTGLSSGVIDKMVAGEKFTPELVKSLKDTLLVFEEAMSEIEEEISKKIFQKSKSKIPSMIYAIHIHKDLINNNTVKLSSFFQHFFGEGYAANDFSTYSSASTTKKVFVEKRTSILEKSLLKWFGGGEEANEERV